MKDGSVVMTSLLHDSSWHPHRPLPHHIPHPIPTTPTHNHNTNSQVTMETMLKFKRLSDLSKEADVIVAAIKQSKAGLIAVSEVTISPQSRPAS